MSRSAVKSLAKIYDVREPDDAATGADAGRPRPTGGHSDPGPGDAASFVPVPVYAPRWTRWNGAGVDGRPPAKTTAIEPFDADEELALASSDGARFSSSDGARDSSSDGARDSSSDGARDSSSDGARFSSSDGARDSYSASSDTPPSSASDWARDDPFARKLRRYSSLAVRRNRRWSSDDDGGGTRDLSPSTADRDEPFFTPETTVLTRHGSGSSQYRRFQHRFHWSENIENGSPWVRHRTKEIFNHVSSKGLFDTQRRETLSNGSEENISLGSTSDTACDDCNETSGNITYEVANKLCDSLKKHNHNNNNNIVLESRCPLSEHFKWTKLYEELVNYGAL